MSALYEATAAVVMLRGPRFEPDPLRDAAMLQYVLETIERLPLGLQMQPGLLRLAMALAAGDVFQLDVEVALDDISLALRALANGGAPPPSDTVPAGTPDGCLSELPCEVEPRDESAVDFSIVGMAVWGGCDAVQ